MPAGALALGPRCGGCQHRSATEESRVWPRGRRSPRAEPQRIQDWTVTGCDSIPLAISAAVRYCACSLRGPPQTLVSACPAMISRQPGLVWLDPWVLAVGWSWYRKGRGSRTWESLHGLPPGQLHDAAKTAGRTRAMLSGCLRLLGWL